MQQDSQGPNLERALSVLRRRAPLILLLVALAAGAAYGLSKHQTKKYTATASLVFNNNQTNQQVAGLQAVSVNNQQAQQNTNLKLVQLGDMAGQDRRDAWPGLTEGKLSATDLSVSAQGESNIVDVAATATSPAWRPKSPTPTPRCSSTSSRTPTTPTTPPRSSWSTEQLATLTAKERVSPTGIALAGRAQSLGVLAELRQGTVQVAQAATVPTSPSSPKVARNTVLGAVLGLLLGLGIAFPVGALRSPDQGAEGSGVDLWPSSPRRRSRERGPLAHDTPRQRSAEHPAARRGRGLPSDPRASALLQRRSRSAHAAGRIGRAWGREDDRGASSGRSGGGDGLARAARGVRPAPPHARPAARHSIWARVIRRADRRDRDERGHPVDRPRRLIGGYVQATDARRAGSRCHPSAQPG